MARPQAPTVLSHWLIATKEDALDLNTGVDPQGTAAGGCQLDSYLEGDPKEVAAENSPSPCPPPAPKKHI